MPWSELSRMDGRALAVVGFFAVVPAIWIVRQARRMASRDLLGDWAASHAVEVPVLQADAVRRHLRRLVWARGIGAAGGWVVGTITPIPAGPWGGVVLGYIVSTVVAECRAQRVLGSGVASLAPRRLEAYVPTPAIWAIRLLGVAVLVVAVMPLAVRHHPQANGNPARIVVIAVIAAFVGAAGEFCTRRVVARRQTAGSPELLAVDDALRSTSAHLLVASVLAVELLGFAIVGATASSTVAPAALRWGLGLTALVSGLSAIGVLHLLAPRPWKVRRTLAGTAA
ncbi:MAG: hypothetical protein M3Q68_09570 [Actinomycetota bacterium]|nr:hypothetical protein [Actinomycetota bacterium]